MPLRPLHGCPASQLRKIGSAPRFIIIIVIFIIIIIILYIYIYVCVCVCVCVYAVSCMSHTAFSPDLYYLFFCVVEF
jgi:hypothetical protein